jgi:hypothetical protein
MCRPTKAKVKELYGFECQFCLKKRDKKFLTIHHVLPIKFGGLRIPENERPMCTGIADCHLIVHNKKLLLNTRGEVILILPENKPIIPLFYLPQQEVRILTLAA